MLICFTCLFICFYCKRDNEVKDNNKVAKPDLPDPVTIKSEKVYIVPVNVEIRVPQDLIAHADNIRELSDNALFKRSGLGDVLLSEMFEQGLISTYKDYDVLTKEWVIKAQVNCVTKGQESGI